MEDFKIEFYKKLDGTSPASVFIQNLEPKMKAKVLRNIGVLAVQNVSLREPLVKPVEDGIFELRTQFGNNITRVFYFFFVGKKIILTNGFTKKTQKTPRREIDTAIAYKNDYINRSDKS